MLTCRCDVWTNGIYWENDDVEVIVEVTEHYRCVTIITSMEDTRKSHKVFNNVIKTVLKLSEMHSFKCEEYLIAPSDVAKARSLLVSERTLYNIKNIARQYLQNVMLVMTSIPRKWTSSRLWVIMTLFFALLL